MNKLRIADEDLRGMLAITSDLSHVRLGFRSKIECALAGIGKLIGATRASSYRLSFIPHHQSVLPIVEFSTNSSGSVRRTHLVQFDDASLQLEALGRATKVITTIGIPPWEKDLHLKSLLNASRTIYSTQYVEGSNLSVALLFERSPRLVRFTAREKMIVNTMWNSIRVVRDAQDRVAARVPN